MIPFFFSAGGSDVAKKMDKMGIEPTAFRMRSERSTTELLTQIIIPRWALVHI